MALIDITNPASIIYALGVKFFGGFIIGAVATYYFTKKVNLSLGIGLAVGALIFLIVS